MLVKKVAAKPFHNANRLNGNGAAVHAKYGVFDLVGNQVGYVHCCGGCWDAYRTADNRRINGYTAPSLAELKKQLANIH